MDTEPTIPSAASLSDAASASQISMNARSLRRVYLQFPSLPLQLTQQQKLKRALLCSILAPIYLLIAYRYRTPGLRLHLKCAFLGLNLLFNRKATFSYGWIHSFLYFPIDTTRYFEFDFMWRALSQAPIRHYLDVSSPRLFPALLALKKRELTTDLINPDAKDMTVTANLVKAAGITNRCRVHGYLIEDVPFKAETFDAITSISVVEHIPQDSQAVQKMWGLLRPGGKLLLSVPCAAHASEQYINFNDYGVLKPDETGYLFFQFIYDEASLHERIFVITGQPARYAIYGEKRANFLRENLKRKAVDPGYPYWREPYMMGQEFRYFERLTDLPGEGVIAMEFIKP